jgi:predicted transcriptional regulator
VEWLTRTEASALFFELSHPKRLAVLRALRDGPCRSHDLANGTRASAPEVSRHVARLARRGLVDRGPDASYRLTPYGRMVTGSVPTFDFLLRHREYFRTHDLAGLPTPFVHRLAELGEPAEGSTFTDTLRYVEQILREAHEFAWFLTDQPLLTPATVTGRARETGISVRILVPRALVGPGSASRPVGGSAVTLRRLPAVSIGIAMNERLAGVSFSGIDGRIDHSAGFRGASGSFRGWCRDLFEHFWSAGAPARL